jgi:hypothetical protein
MEAFVASVVSMGTGPVPLLFLLLIEYLSAEGRLFIIVSTARPHFSATAA